MYLHVLIKFGKSEYLPKFRSDGIFRMAKFEEYRTAENTEVGDQNEGAYEIGMHTNVQISKRDAKTGLYKEIGKSSFMVSRHFNELNESSKVFCMYYTTIKLDDVTHFRDFIDIKLIERFGYDYAVVIYNPEKFYERLDHYFDSKKMPYRRGMVNYLDLANGGENLTPFDKDLQFSHQKEFRLCVQGMGNEPSYFAEIGSIEDISVECTLEDLDTLKVVRQK